MPRKSKAELSVAPVTVPRVIPRPPSHLTPAQSEVWRTGHGGQCRPVHRERGIPRAGRVLPRGGRADRIAAEVDRFDMAGRASRTA